MAGIAFPSWAYNSAGQQSVIVASQAAFNALAGAGTWSFSPFPTATSSAPFDPGFQVTDIRLQQILVEMRMANNILQYQNALADDPITELRPEIVANDSSLTS